MIELFNTGAYLLNGTELVKDDADAQKVLASKNINVTKEEAAKNTIAYGILEAHNTSGNMDSLKIKFDCMFVMFICTKDKAGIKFFTAFAFEARNG